MPPCLWEAISRNYKMKPRWKTMCLNFKGLAASSCCCATSHTSLSSSLASASPASSCTSSPSSCSASACSSSSSEKNCGKKTFLRLRKSVQKRRKWLKTNLRQWLWDAFLLGHRQWVQPLMRTFEKKNIHAFSEFPNIFRISKEVTGWIISTWRLMLSWSNAVFAGWCSPGCPGKNTI